MRLRLNLKPELDRPAFSIPKIHLNLELEKLSVCISKAQYRDIIALTESISRMTIGSEFRKYRPDLNVYKGHAKEWWHFAYKCVLEHDVRRVKRNWDWNRIKYHRMLCKEYKNLYERKVQSNLIDNAEARLKELEKELDAFNIIIIRQRVELEAERLEKAPERQRSWFSGWWSRKSVDIAKSSSDTGDIGE